MVSCVKASKMLQGEVAAGVVVCPSREIQHAMLENDDEAVVLDRHALHFEPADFFHI